MGYSGSEGGGVGGGEGGGARAWDSASSPRETPAGTPKMLRHGHVALGFKVPAVGGCPEVRASEPAGGTYPHNRFLDHVHVDTHARCTSKGQSPPCLSLTPPPPPQYGVTELGLPPAPSRHPQTCRRSLLANPSPNEGIDPVVSRSIRTPACSHVNPRRGLRNLCGRRLHCPRDGWGRAALVRPFLFNSLCSACSQRKEKCLSSSIPRVASLA